MDDTATQNTMHRMRLLFIAFVISLVRWATQPDFTLLFTGLEPTDAQQITEDLRSSNTKYKIDDGGRSILVPKKQVYELRMKYAAQDIPTTGGIGYEIFDKKDIGISEFVQQVNYRRALEGELGRTIQTIPEINRVRVHIVFPKERLFKEDQKEPTASIFLVIPIRIS